MKVNVVYFTLIGLPALLLTQKVEAQDCNPGIVSGMAILTSTGVEINYNGRETSVAHVGDALNINLAVSTSILGGLCGVTNGQCWVVYPDNSVHQMMKDFTLLSSAQGGSGHSCPSADPLCLSLNSPYIVNANDINKGLLFTTNNGTIGNTCQALPQPHEVQFALSVIAEPVNIPGGAANCIVMPVLVLFPSVSIDTFCETNWPSNCDSTITFRGTVRNTSDTNTILYRIAVSSVPAAAITFSTVTSQGNPFDPTVGNLNNQLLPGDSVEYTGSYAPAGSGGPFTNTVSVAAQDVTGLVLSNSATATCNLCTKIVGVKLDGKSFAYSFATKSNRAYTIQFSDSLSPASWHTLTNLVGDGAIATVRDSMTNAQRFYRAFAQ